MSVFFIKPSSVAKQWHRCKLESHGILCENLIKVPLEIWSRDAQAAKLKDRNVVLVCEGKACTLTSSDTENIDREVFHDLT